MNFHMRPNLPNWNSFLLRHLVADEFCGGLVEDTKEEPTFMFDKSKKEYKQARKKRKSAEYGSNNLTKQSYKSLCADQQITRLAELQLPHAWSRSPGRPIDVGLFFTCTPITYSAFSCLSLPGGHGFYAAAACSSIKYQRHRVLAVRVRSYMLPWSNR